jgi:hypothetical protein
MFSGCVSTCHVLSWYVLWMCINVSVYSVDMFSGCVSTCHVLSWYVLWMYINVSCTQLICSLDVYQRVMYSVDVFSGCVSTCHVLDTLIHIQRTYQLSTWHVDTHPENISTEYMTRWYTSREHINWVHDTLIHIQRTYQLSTWHVDTHPENISTEYMRRSDPKTVDGQQIADSRIFRFKKNPVKMYICIPNTFI